MGAESTTMADMSEPTPIAATVDQLLAKVPHLKRAADLYEGRELDQSRAETAEDRAARNAERVEHYQARWDRQVPPMYHDADVEALDETDQHGGRVRYWLQSGGLHLVMAGPVGTGKTYAAYAVGNQALRSGMWVEAWNVGDLLDAMRPGSADRSAEQRAKDCQLLILDDLVGKATEWEAERMTLLLDARTREMRQTIVTTNITGDQVAETWGRRFMDRLRFRMTSLVFTGESRRADW